MTQMGTQLRKTSITDEKSVKKWTSWCP